jgi:myosin protein heavy chain
MQVDEEQRRREDFREQYLASEKRIAILQSEKEEYANAVESAERARRQAELELTV